MSQRQFGEMVGVTHGAVQKAIRAGRITLNANGKIDSEAALAEWHRNTDESKRSFTDLSRAARASASSPSCASASGVPVATNETEGAAADGAGEKEEDPSLARYRAARAGREEHRQEREQLELEQRRGNLIPLAEAQRLGFTALRTVRDAVLNVPVRVKDIVAAEGEPARVERLLRDELMSALSAIDLAAIMRDEDPENQDGS